MMTANPTVPIVSVAPIATTIYKNRRASRFIGLSGPSITGSAGAITAGLLSGFGWLQGYTDVVAFRFCPAVLDHSFGGETAAVDPHSRPRRHRAAREQPDPVHADVMDLGGEPLDVAGTEGN